MMNDYGKSDSPIIPKKSPNKVCEMMAEVMEERGLAKGNPLEQNATRAQNRTSAPERIHQAAKKDKALRFTTLYHHVYDVKQLRAAYQALKSNAAPGLDGMTWKTYGEELEVNLAELSERLKRGAYRAVPVLRVHIPKADGRQRPIGLLILEDKIVQRATAEVMNAVYEQDFLGFSYGSRRFESVIHIL